MIETKNLIKTFRDGERETRVLKGIDFTAADGEFVAVMGRSGAGKSTFLYQISLLDDPTSGEVVVAGHDTHAMSPDEKINFRLTRCGYVFQDYALLPELTALENVMLPLMMQGMRLSSARPIAEEALARVNMRHRLASRPSHLSGGEQQRASIARAVAHRPRILFADEPTANLDNESSGIVMEIFRELHRAGQTIVMVTHEEQYAAMAQRIVIMDDGKIVSVGHTA
jgi:putative ABC transport system ATP-binding protein